MMWPSLGCAPATGHAPRGPTQAKQSSEGSLQHLSCPSLPGDWIPSQTHLKLHQTLSQMTPPSLCTPYVIPVKQLYEESQEPSTEAGTHA